MTSVYPDVSVIIAAFQARETIREAVSSALADRSAEAEVIVVDDGSTDGTHQALAKDCPQDVQLVRLHKNVGRSAARNTGIARSRGKFIAILDADDITLKGRFGRQAAMLDSCPNLAAVGAQVMEFGNWGEQPGLSYPSDPMEIQRQFYRGRMAMAHGASMFRKDWMEAIGGYDEELRWCEDFDLFLRGLHLGEFAALSDIVLRYRRPKRSTTWRYWYENERHRRAVYSRFLDSGRQPRKGSLVVRDDPFLKAYEAMRYLAITARDNMSRG